MVDIHVWIDGPTHDTHTHTGIQKQNCSEIVMKSMKITAK